MSILEEWIRRHKETSAGKGREIDYRVFYALGACLMGLGVVFGASISPAYFSFLGAGVIFPILGMSHGNVKNQ